MKTLSEKDKSLKKSITFSRWLTLAGIIIIPLPIFLEVDLMKGGLAMSALGVLLFISGFIAWMVLGGMRNATGTMLEGGDLCARWITEANGEVIISKNGVYYGGEIYLCDAYSNFFVKTDLSMDGILSIRSSHKGIIVGRNHNNLKIQIPEDHMVQVSQIVEHYRKTGINKI